MINFKKNNFQIQGYDFTNHIEATGFILKNFISIEDSINQVITLYFKPQKDKLKDFENIMLNSSIINTGSKIKVLRNIPNFDNKIADKISKITFIRNAFAHNNIHREIDLSEKESKSNMFVMNSSGIIKIKDEDDLILEYSELVNEIENYLKKYFEENKR